MPCDNVMVYRFSLYVRPNTCMPDTDPMVQWIMANMVSSPSMPGWRQLTNVTKIGGLDLGTEGKIEVPTWEKIIEVPDGRRKLAPMPIQFLVSNRVTIDTGTTDTDFWFAWARGRKAASLDMRATMVTRAGHLNFIWDYSGVEMSGFKGEDLDNATPKVPYIDVELSPQDVRLLDCNFDPITHWSEAESNVLGPLLCM